jgi:hypothetical protein
MKLHAGPHFAVRDEEDAPSLKNPSGGAAKRGKGGHGVKDEGREELFVGTFVFSLMYNLTHRFDP